MKILYVGVFGGPQDEGLSQFSGRVLNYFSARHAVLALGTRTALTLKGIKAARAFRPDVIHYLTGPTVRSLAVTTVLRRLLPGNPKTVVSATRPYFGTIGAQLVSFLRPDLVLTQASVWEHFFTARNIRSRFVPNGVDLSRFQPATAERRRLLRARYGIGEQDFVVLHIGHLKRSRGLELLCRSEIPRDYRFVVVGSTAERADAELIRELRAAGIEIVHEFQPRVEELYQAADCYLFPVAQPMGGKRCTYDDGGCVDTPLSVLEAMATNLPVVTTRFGALPRMFPEDRGMFFFDGSPADLLSRLERVRHCPPVATRSMVLGCGWDDIFASVAAAYDAIEAKHDREAVPVSFFSA